MNSSFPKLWSSMISTKYSILEKEAQGETFGPFQYVNLAHKLKKLIENLVIIQKLSYY